MASSDLQALRQLARQRRRAATDKIRRLRNQGIDLAGTEHDPRRSVTAINRYNRSQLNSYVNALNKLTSRQTSFLAGAEGQPLPRQKWERYKSLEARINEINAQHLESIRNIKLPNQDMTIGQRRATILPDRLAALGERSERPYAERNRIPQHIEGSDALDALIRDAQRKLKREYLPTRLKAGREQLNHMLEELGNTEFQKVVKDLTDHQFNILWNDTNLPNDVSQNYWLAKAGATTTSDRWYSRVIQDNTNDIRDLLNAAADYPTSPTPIQKAKRRRKKS